MKVLVAYDGTLQSKEALRFGLQKVRQEGGEVVALHVFHSGMFIDYDSHPDAVGRARREAFNYVDEARQIVSDFGSGIRVRVLTVEGVPDEEIVSFVMRRDIDMVICPPGLKNVVKKIRVASKGNDPTPGRLCRVDPSVMVLH